MNDLRTVEEKTDTGKPILELKEHDDFHWMGNEFTILPKEDKLVERLEEEFSIRIISKRDRIRISAKDDVGVIEFENFVLRVKPKFVKFKNFGKLIDFANDIEYEQFDDEIRFQSDIDSGIEWVIRSFLATTQKLIRGGLYGSYEEQHEDVSFLRGKLLMKQQILNDLKFNMKFHCEFDEFTSNNLENQIIRYTLEQCRFLTKFPRKKKLIQRLIHQIDSQVEYKTITIEDFREIAYTRLNARYAKPHLLAKLIIKNMGLQNLNYQRTKFIIPFFVRMYDVWELFVTNLFENYYDNRVRVKPQDYQQAWFKDGSPKKGIQPDIVIYNKDGKVLSMIDAKYMHELKEKEMYQIAFYINHLKCSTGYAILPYERNRDHELSVKKQNISIKVRHIPIDEYLNILYAKKPSKEIKEEISSKLKKIVPITA